VAPPFLGGLFRDPLLRGHGEVWNFQFGHDRVDWKKAPKFVRLVRGSGQNLPEVKD